MNQTQKKEIVELYLNPNFIGSYGSVTQFQKNLAETGFLVPLIELRNILKEYIPSLTVDKPQLIKFPRRVHLASCIDDQWSADLFFLSPDLLRANRVGAFLIIVDVLSHFCFVRPVKSRKSADVAAAFNQIIEETGRKPFTLITDQGSEFLGSSFQNLLKHKSIEHRIARQLPVKAHTAELHIRLLKNIIKSYLRQHKTKQFREVLPGFVNSLNNRRLDRLAGLSPVEISSREQSSVVRYLQTESEKRASGPKIEIGALVRIQLPKSAFSETRKERYSEELFKIIDRLESRNPWLYKLADLAGEPLTRLWYANQIAVVAP